MNQSYCSRYSHSVEKCWLGGENKSNQEHSTEQSAWIFPKYDLLPSGRFVFMIVTLHKKGIYFLTCCPPHYEMKTRGTFFCSRIIWAYSRPTHHPSLLDRVPLVEDLQWLKYCLTVCVKFDLLRFCFYFSLTTKVETALFLYTKVEIYR